MSTLETSKILLGSTSTFENSEPTGWHEVNWEWVHSSVESMRREVFSSARNKLESNLRKVQVEILTHPATLLYAIRKSSSRSGANNPGVDNQTVTTAEEKWQLFTNLKGLNLYDWNPPPVKRVYVLKADKKRWRPLGIPTIKDRIIQVVVNEALEPEWESK
jgi:RNA-directed DNA polymerase